MSKEGIQTLETDEGVSTEDYAYSVIRTAVPAALLPKDVERASEVDDTLRIVRQCLMSGDWKQLTGTVYKAVKDELWMAGQMVMRGMCLVMPEKLWLQTIELAHEGHQGVARTKSRLREKVWWPDIDKQVESLIKACYPCQLVGKQQQPEPIKLTSLPDGPWMDIAVDLLDIPGGGHLLVVVDYFSRWPEVANLPQKTARHVNKCLESMFQTHGLPETLRSDNGPPFASTEFESFLSHLGIEHKKGVPYWPQSNGAVERLNGTLLKIVRIAHIEKKDWKTELGKFLFHYRTTPHTVTNISPAELMMGRKLRDKIPRVRINSEGLTDTDRKEMIAERDAVRKLKEKEYADKRRRATPSNIMVGDQVLVKQLHRENKLTPTFDPTPYEVIRREGNAVIVQSPNGPQRMRNTAHVKKFIPPIPDPQVEAEISVPRNGEMLGDNEVTVEGPTTTSRLIRERKTPAERTDSAWVDILNCSGDFIFFMRWRGPLRLETLKELTI